MSLENTASLPSLRKTVSMKTCELAGKPLRYAVAAADGFNPRNIYGDVVEMFLPRYDTEWSEAGVIVDREDIQLTKAGLGLHLARIDCDEGDAMVHQATGHTKLIAAMRCFVASVLGESVDIPEEVLQ